MVRRHADAHGASFVGACVRRHGPKVTQPATEADASLVARAVSLFGSQARLARDTGIPQHRLSRASVAGKGRALSASHRAVLRDVLSGACEAL